MKAVTFDNMDDDNDFKKYDKESDEISLKQESDVKAYMDGMNSDSVDAHGYTDIDTKTRLSAMETGSILTLDTWVRLGALPFDCLALSRGRKRLNISLFGLGRQELRDGFIADNNRKAPSQSGFMNGVKSFFGLGGDKNQ